MKLERRRCGLLGEREGKNVFSGENEKTERREEVRVKQRERGIGWLVCVILSS